MKQKRSSIYYGFVLSVLLATTAVHAQAASKMYTNVPFEFEAGGKTLPAGDYKVFQSRSNPLLVMVQSRETNDTATILTIPFEAHVSGKTKLVFERHGTRHLLSQVFWAGKKTGSGVPMPSLERQIAHP